MKKPNTRNAVPTVGTEIRINVERTVDNKQGHEGRPFVKLKYNEQLGQWTVNARNEAGGLMTYIVEDIPANGNTLRIASIAKTGKAVYGNIVYVPGNDAPVDPFAPVSVAP